ncbi:MAG: T9SS type A sorting domain-containing protein [Bacteroidota bacterium]
MKSSLHGFFSALFIFLFSLNGSAQFYGVSFDNDLANSGGGWSSRSTNNVFWTTTSVAAPTVTGINTNPQNGSGFAYTETDGIFNGSQTTAFLESPCFDLSGTITRVQFAYQMLGDVDSFYLEVSFDDGISYNQQVLSVATGTTSDWVVENTTGLSINGSVRFRFAVIFNAGTSSIVALDQLQLFGAQQNDAMDCPDLDCVENLTLNNTTLSEDFYRAKNQLSSNATIAANDDVTFTAGNQIILREGFVASNTTFTARIADCDARGAALLEYYTRLDPLPAEEIEYFDRFGNGYSRDELEFELFNNDTTCYSGVFQLNFQNNVSEEEQAVVCAVFAYLDSLIVSPVADSSVVIDILKDTLSAGVLATGTPFWDRLDCGIANSVVEKILIGADPNQFGFIHGRIRINESFQDRFFTDLNNPPTDADDDDFHFYTIMLHEALHVLGFASLIDEDDTPLDIEGNDQTVVGEAFSRYDQYLFSLTQNDFLLAPDATGDCCDEHLYQLMGNPQSGCSLSFRDGITDLATVDGTAGSNRLNLLSHFNTRCDNGQAQYVMHPAISTLGSTISSNEAQAIRSRLTCAELQTLYLIGYDVEAAILAQNGCSLPSSGGACDVLAVDDTYVFDLEENELDTFIFIQNDPNSVLSNDLLATDATTFAFESMNGIVINENGDTLNIIENGDTLLLSTNASSVFNIPYTITGCNDELCDDGLITIIVRGCVADLQINPCEGCDLICSGIGNFECFRSEEEINLFFTGGIGDNGYLFTQNFNSPNLPPRYNNFRCRSSTSSNFPPIEGMNTVGIIGFARQNQSSRSEGLVVPLCEPVRAGEEITLSFSAVAPTGCVGFNPRIRVEFLNPDPIIGQSVYDLTPPPFSCQDVVVNDQIAAYTINCENTASINWNYLLISTILDSGADGGSIGIDDIRVTKQKSITIIAAPNVANLCEDGEFTIDYELFNDHCSPSDSLSLQLNVPNDLDLDALGAFAENTTIKIAPLAPGESRFLQARLRTNDQSTIGQSTAVILNITPDGCYLPSADTIPVNFIDSPLSDLDKTLVESSLDTFDIDITVCNSLEDTIRNVQITDELPPEFQIVEAGAFEFISNLGGNFVQLDTFLPPASGGVDACLTFSYRARAVGNYCPRTLTARANIPQSNCSSVSDAVEVEDSDLPEPDANFNFSIDCATGNATFSSLATGSGLMHIWAFGDGDSSFVANPTHTYDSLGTYTVVHVVDNGCEPPSEVSKEVTYEPCPDNFNCDCPNSTSIGTPPFGTTNVSQTGIALNYNNTNQCLKIAGNLLIDTDFTITGGDVLLEPDASIIVQSNQTLTINNANLSSCDNYMWRGIEVAENGNVLLNGDTISDAINGVILNRDAIFDIQNNLFDRNFQGIQVLQTPTKIALQNNTFSCSDTLNNGFWGLAGIRVSDAFISIGNSSSVNEPNTFKDIDYGVVARNAFVTVADASFSNLRFEPTVRRLDNTNSIAVSASNGGRTQVINCDIQQVHQGIRIGAGEAFVQGNVISNIDSAITIRRINLFEKVDINANDIEAGLRGIAFQNFSFPASATITNNDIDVNFFRYTYVENDDFGPEPIGIAVELFELGDLEYADIQGNSIQMQTGQTTVDPLTFGISCRSAEGVDISNNEIFSIGDTLTGGGLSFGIDLVDVENVLIKDCTIRDSLASSGSRAVVARAATNVSYCCNDLDVAGRGFDFLGACFGTNLNINTIGAVGDTMNTGVLCGDTTVIGVQVYEVPGSTFERRHRGNRWTANAYGYGARHRGNDNDVEASRFIVKNNTSDFYPQNASIADVDPTSFFNTDNTINQLPDCEENFECNFRSDELGFFSETDLRIANDEFNIEMLRWEGSKFLLNKLQKASLVDELPTELAIFKERLGRSSIERFWNIQNQKKRIFKSHSETVNKLRSLNLELADLTTLIEDANSLSEKRSLTSQFESFRQKQNEHLQQMNQIAQNWYSNLIVQNASVSHNQRLAQNEYVVNTIQFSYFKEEDIKLSNLQKEALFNIAKQCPRTGGRFVYRARTLYNLLAEKKEFNDTRCFNESDSNIEQRVEEIKTAFPPKIHIYPNPALDRVFIQSTERLKNHLFNIQFIDFTGKTLISQNVDSNNEVIDISHLQSGIYFCVIMRDGQRSQVQKIIVIK